MIRRILWILLGIVLVLFLVGNPASGGHLVSGGIHGLQHVGNALATFIQSLGVK